LQNSRKEIEHMYTHCEYAAVKCTYFENTRDETVPSRRKGESTLNIRIWQSQNLKTKNILGGHLGAQMGPFVQTS
jgi:hypothetical protein